MSSFVAINGLMPGTPSSTSQCSQVLISTHTTVQHLCGQATGKGDYPADAATGWFGLSLCIGGMGTFWGVWGSGCELRTASEHESSNVQRRGKELDVFYHHLSTVRLPAYQIFTPGHGSVVHSRQRFPMSHDERLVCRQKW